MNNFLELVEHEALTDTACLVIGKGPSFSQLASYDVSGFITIALNHVVRELAVDIAHAIDLDVVVDCAEAIDRQARYLVMPWYPNIDSKPGSRNLEQCAEENQMLRKLDNEGRLYWYNSSQSKQPARGGYPIIPVRYFSADAVVALLAYSDIKTVRTIGVDGGRRYDQQFVDLNRETLLSNGQQSFDLQFEAIARTVMQTGIDFAHLGAENDVVKVYVGSQPEQMLAVKVLEYSIKRHTTAKVEVFAMHLADVEVPMPRRPEQQPRTPFSFQRFLIPELNDFKGRAIYFDCDMMVLKDIRLLWSMPMGTSDLLSAWNVDESGRVPQFSVMLMDCEKLGWKIHEIIRQLDNDTLSYEELMFEMKVVQKIGMEIDSKWNSLERYEDDETCLIHYTEMHTHPWLNCRNELAYLWVEQLREAIRDNFTSNEFLLEEIAAGHVRPSLYYQVRRKKFDVQKLPAWVKLLDRHFIAPHVRAMKNKQLSTFGRLYNRLVFHLMRLF